MLTDTISGTVRKRDVCVWVSLPHIFGEKSLRDELIRIWEIFRIMVHHV